MIRDFLAGVAFAGVIVGAVMIAAGALAERGEPDYNERYTICAVVQEPPGLRCVSADSMEFFRQ